MKDFDVQTRRVDRGDCDKPLNDLENVILLLMGGWYE